jgi:hypothetical protein
MARLKVYRLSSGNTWTVVGESTIQTLTSNVVNTFPTSIAVNAGDRIAILTTSGSFNCGGGAPFANVAGLGDGTDHPAGSSETFSPRPGFRVDLSAVLSNCPDPAGAFNQGFNPGFNSGFNSGFKSGFKAGFNPGFRAGFRHSVRAQAIAAQPTYPACNTQFNQGFNSGFNPGFNAGFKPGFKAGFNSGFNAGFKARHHIHHSAATSSGTRTEAPWRPR